MVPGRGGVVVHGKGGMEVHGRGGVFFFHCHAYRFVQLVLFMFIVLLVENAVQYTGVQLNLF